MKFDLRVIFALSGAFIVGSAFAQTPTTDSQKLVNIDTAHVLAPGAVSVRADFRDFGGDEGKPYGTVDLNLGIDKGFGLLLRSTFASVSNFYSDGFDIRHGGLDGEALLKYSYPKWTNLAVLGGVAFVNTPAHQGELGVAEAVYEYPFKGFELYGNAKVVTGGDTTLFALAAGGSVDLAKGFQLIGDVTFPLTGRNTYSTSSGDSERDAIYGVALRYTVPGSTKESLSFDAGVTNGLGGSTGFSLTPSLGSTVGLFIAATYRF